MGPAAAAAVPPLRLLLLLLLLHPHQSHAFCAAIGANPGFSGPPTVKQVNLTVVQVSWADVATRVDCADQFLVKSGLISSPSLYTMSDMVSTQTFSMLIYDRLPEQEYFYEAIAREDKNWRGVEYNRSPHTVFATSRKNQNMKAAEVARSSPTKEERRDSPVPGVQVSATAQGGSPGVEERSQAERIETSKSADSQVVNTEILVWIVVGSLAVIVILVGVVYNIVKRRRGRNKEIELDSNFGDEEDEDEEEDGGGGGALSHHDSDGGGDDDDTEDKDSRSRTLTSDERSSSVQFLSRNGGGAV